MVGISGCKQTNWM